MSNTSTNTSFQIENEAGLVPTMSFFTQTGDEDDPQAAAEAFLLAVTQAFPGIVFSAVRNDSTNVVSMGSVVDGAVVWS